MDFSDSNHSQMRMPRTHTLIERIIYRLTLLYFFLTPIETTINRVTISSIKYIIIVMFVVFILGMMHERKNIAIHKYAVFEVIWLILTLVSMLWSTQPMNFSLIITYASMVSLLIIFSDTGIMGEKEYQLCLMAYMLGGLLLAIILIGWGQTGRAYSLSGRLTINIMGIEGGDENNLSAVIAPGVIIAFGRMMSSKKRMVKLFFLLSMIALLYAQMLTGSRGGLLSSTIGLFCALLFSSTGGKKIIGTILVVLAVYILIDKYLPEVLQTRFLNIEGYQSGSGRKDIWEVALAEWGSHPIFGLGLNGWYTASVAKMGRLYGTHNTYLKVALDVGIVGLVFYLFPYVDAIRLHIKNKSGVGLGILIAAMVSGFFLDSLQVRYLWNGLLLTMMAMSINAMNGGGVTEKRVNW